MVCLTVKPQWAVLFVLCHAVLAAIRTMFLFRSELRYINTAEVIMKNTIIKILKNTWGLLVFALLSGAAYYAAVLKFILANTEVGGSLLAFFLFPCIVCGAALILIKTVRQCLESEREGAAAAIFLLHVLFIMIGIVFFVSIFK